MRGKITLIGDAGEALEGMVGDGRVDVVRLADSDGSLLAGSEVVVAGTDVDVARAASDVARRAPGAVLLLRSESPESAVQVALETSLLPRPRVFGVAAEDAAAATEAVLWGRETELRCWALCRGELGIDDRVERVPVVVGAGGLRRIGD